MSRVAPDPGSERLLAYPPTPARLASFQCLDFLAIGILIEVTGVVIRAVRQTATTRFVSRKFDAFRHHPAQLFQYLFRMFTEFRRGVVLIATQSHRAGHILQGFPISQPNG